MGVQGRTQPYIPHTPNHIQHMTHAMHTHTQYSHTTLPQNKHITHPIEHFTHTARTHSAHTQHSNRTSISHTPSSIFTHASHTHSAHTHHHVHAPGGLAHTRRRSHGCGAAATAAPSPPPCRGPLHQVECKSNISWYSVSRISQTSTTTP